jgi:benzoylformate decarboxylase
MLLELNIMQYWKEQGVAEHEFPKPFKLYSPVVDFVKIAESMGVSGVKVETLDQIVPAIKQSLAYDGPFLIDLVVTSKVPGAQGH